VFASQTDIKPSNLSLPRYSLWMLKKSHSTACIWKMWTK